MDRREKILYKCNLDGIGLEIGPSFSPVLPKRDGYNVETLDVLDKEGLQERFAAVDKNGSIEEVNYVWNGEPYPQLIGKTNYYDYIIASHVIEHSCDLIGFFSDCSALLKDDGILSLAVPDKRYTFDFLRPVTGIARVLENHGRNRNAHSPGAVYEHNSSVCHLDLKLLHSIQDAIDGYNLSVKQNNYIDSHTWVFTQTSFELLIYDLSCLGLTDLCIDSSFDTFDHEFFVSLKKRKEKFVPNDEKRLELAMKAHYESTSRYFTDKLNALQAENTALGDKISDIYSSRSWKVTKPLRYVSAFFKRSK